MSLAFDDELLAWLALARVPGLGAARCRALVGESDSASAVLAERPEHCLGESLGAAVIAGLRQPDWAGAEADLAWRDSPDKHVLCLSDPRYPPLLAQLSDAPTVLYVLGDAALLRAAQLAVVGSRNPTALGRETAEAFAAGLTQAGLVITSGLALGIDGAAHEGALRAGHTLAVCGTGLDRVYPARHKALAHRIAAQGALISEFPPGTLVQASNFPRRNRLIAGLSLGTLVVEAALQSGSLITARLALDYGREVFAIPGSIHNPLARGCHALIREGAKLVECAEDVLEELGALAGLEFAAAPAPGMPTALPGLDAQEQAVLAAVDHAPTSVDRVIARTGLPAPVVSGSLLGLELRGLLALSAGGYQRLAP
ncbi:MAG: DNA-protecting protein DprA [Gammaproteobacteria bacterium]|nr:DNA-protecting protein DprA [Gammaproteobacteria bacterium]